MKDKKFPKVNPVEEDGNYFWLMLYHFLATQGKTFRQMSEEIGASNTKIGQWQRNIFTPTHKELNTIHKTYGLSLQTMIDSVNGDIVPFFFPDSNYTPKPTERPITNPLTDIDEKEIIVDSDIHKIISIMNEHQTEETTLFFLIESLLFIIAKRKG